MATVRLDIITEMALKRLAVRRGQAKSEVIRDAIAASLKRRRPKPRPTNGSDRS
jgi:predicted transcriptional regulator